MQYLFVLFVLQNMMMLPMTLKLTCSQPLLLNLTICQAQAQSWWEVFLLPYRTSSRRKTRLTSAGCSRSSTSWRSNTRFQSTKGRRGYSRGRRGKTRLFQKRFPHYSMFYQPPNLMYMSWNLTLKLSGMMYGLNLLSPTLSSVPFIPVQRIPSFTRIRRIFPANSSDGPPLIWYITWLQNKLGYSCCSC